MDKTEKVGIQGMGLVDFNIQPLSLNTKRYRLKKKMELDKDLLIGEYINKLFTQELESA